MNNIKPVNGHILIKPLKEDGFIVREREQYEEIGVVIDICSTLTTYTTTYTSGTDRVYQITNTPKIGSKVYFDSWMVAKYPNGKEGYFYLVKWSDVRAVEEYEQQ